MSFRKEKKRENRTTERLIECILEGISLLICISKQKEDTGLKSHKVGAKVSVVLTLDSRPNPTHMIL